MWKDINGKKKVSQAVIATRSGVDRTTVNKILNHYPTDRSSKKTTEKVLNTASEMGYKPQQMYGKRNRRRELRKIVNLKSEINIVLSDGSIYDIGTGQIANLSLSGALFNQLKTNKGNLPLHPCLIRLKINHPALKDCLFQGDFLRVQMNGKLDFGIHFHRLDKKTRKALSAYLKRR